MLRIAVIGYLVLASVVGPSLCCCAATSTVSRVRGWFGYDPVTCVNGECCSHSRKSATGGHHHAHHSPPARSAESHHGHELKARRGESSQTPSALAPRRAGEQPHNAPCPCRKHERNQNAVPPTVLAGSKPVIHVSDVPAFAWESFVAAPASAPAAAVFCNCDRARPAGGREILRALHILRC